MEKGKTRILWSGITGRVGLVAQKEVEKRDDVMITCGVCRSGNGFYYYEQLNLIKEKFDVIVDFSNSNSLDTILSLALKKNKPLMIGTAGYSEMQMDMIETAAKQIPIFLGGNFQFTIKKFIDDVVLLARNSEREIHLVETHYKTKKIPSETAKGIVKRVWNETGKNVEITSLLEYDTLENDYRVGQLHCHVCGFEQLSNDIFTIASMMIGQEPNGIYTLDRLMESTLQNVNEKTFSKN